MSMLWASVMQPGWLARLHEVTGRPTLTEGLRQWIARAQIQIFTPPAPAGFEVQYTDQLFVCDAFAAEAIRFSLAAGESTATLTHSDRLPVSRAWQLIQWYYAAYFAAHSLLRMFGQSLTYLERGQANILDAVSVLYGHSAGQITAGYYATTAGPGQQLRFAKIVSSKGSHDDLWQAFSRWMDLQAQTVLATSTVPTAEAQRTATGLLEIAAAMRSANHSNGTWLSGIRNDVTYRHGRNVWFPWKPAHGLPPLVDPSAERVSDAEEELSTLRSAKSELQRFYYACRAVIALCRATCYEMRGRCPAGTSFHAGGLLALDNFARQRGSGLQQRVNRPGSKRRAR